MNYTYRSNNTSLEFRQKFRIEWDVAHQSSDFFLNFCKNSGLVRISKKFTLISFQRNSYRDNQGNCRPLLWRKFLIRIEIMLPLRYERQERQYHNITKSWWHISFTIMWWIRCLIPTILVNIPLSYSPYYDPLNSHHFQAIPDFKSFIRLSRKRRGTNYARTYFFLLAW